MNIRPFTATLLAAAAAALVLGACSRNDDRTAGEQLDSAIAQAQKSTDQAKSDMKKDAEDAKSGAESAGAKMSRGIEKAADAVGDKAQDAAITANINAELAKDPALSALKIDVDTANGRVVLRGVAPTATARDRATRLASTVKGVVSVDNHLEVTG